MFNDLTDGDIGPPVTASAAWMSNAPANTASRREMSARKRRQEIVTPAPALHAAWNAGGDEVLRARSQLLIEPPSLASSVSSPRYTRPPCRNFDREG